MRQLIHSDLFVHFFGEKKTKRVISLLLYEAYYAYLHSFPSFLLAKSQMIVFLLQKKNFNLFRFSFKWMPKIAWLILTRWYTLTQTHTHMSNVWVCFCSVKSNGRYDCSILLWNSINFFVESIKKTMFYFMFRKQYKSFSLTIKKAYSLLFKWIFTICLFLIFNSLYE